MTLNKSVVCPVLIGRAEDLSVLNRLAGQTAQGAGQIALIAGEAGLGKSRLISEAFQIAKKHDSQILKGNCFETDRTLPYAPLLDLLRNFNTGHPSKNVSVTFGSTANELIKILPELEAEGSTLTLEPEQEKHRIFQALAQFLIERSKKRSFVIIEDLHWCDDTSLEFLLYFARRIQNQPILLLMTYRNDEITPNLGHFLAELDRERLSTELALARLTSSEVDAMLRVIFELDRPVRPEFVNVLYKFTEGNPFFIEEILKSLIVGGEVFYSNGIWDRKPIEELNIPRSIHDAVRRRTEKVSENARKVLRIGAAAGQRFDFSLIQDLTGLDEDELLMVVKELMAVQLISEETHERFAFRHALTREAIYSQLIERERRALHQKIGEAIERLNPGALDEQTANLAYHFYQAGAWQKAMEYSQQAAQQARALYAPRAVIEHLTHVQDAKGHLGLSPSAELYRERGSAYGILGDFELARADYEAAQRAAQAAADRTLEWQILLDLGLLWAGRDYSVTGTYYQRAYELGLDMNDPKMLAHVHNRLGNWSVNAEKPAEGLEHHEEALKLFQSQDDRRGLAETLDLLGMANYIHGDLVQSEVYYDQAVEIFREMDDRQALASSLASKMLNSARLQSGIAVIARLDHANSIRSGEEALRLSREIGWRSGETYALIMLGNYYGIRGDYSKAFDLAKESLAVAEEIEHSQWITYSRYVLGMLYLDVLAAPQAQEHLEYALSLANKIGSRWWITNVTGYLALTYILEGELPRATAELDKALEISTATFIEHRTAIRALTMGQRICWYALGELAWSQGNPDAALYIAGQLLDSSSNAPGEGAIPHLSILRGKAFMALEQPQEAEQVLLAARNEADHEVEKPLIWRIECLLGRIYQHQGRRELASEAILKAQKVITEISGNIPDVRLRENFSKQVLSFIPQARMLSTREAAKTEFGGLTAREREVALMIAEGRSNREIADTLFVGERTVESHVSNTLSKLGFTSRAQVAAWAVEKGLSKEKEH